VQTFVASLQASSGDADVLVTGDLNAYGREEPITVFLDAGYEDLLSRHVGPAYYSFVFDGEAGALDHALATPSLAAQVTGAATWAINADEPSVIDYNTEFKPQDLYAPHAYRSSDHDPVLVGLSLVKRIEGTTGRDTLIGLPGDDVIAGGTGADRLTGLGGRDVFVYRSLRDAGDAITDFAPGLDTLDLGTLLASLGIAQATAWSQGFVQLVSLADGTSVRIDVDGVAGPALARSLLLLEGLSATAIDPARDLGL